MKKKSVIIKIVLAVFSLSVCSGGALYRRSLIYAKGSEFFVEIYKTDGTIVGARKLDYEDKPIGFVLHNDTQILSGDERLLPKDLNVGDKIVITCNKVVDLDNEIFISDIETIKLVDTAELGE